MDTVADSPSVFPLRWRHLGAGLAVLALAAYTWMLASHVGAYAGGADSSGYLNQARLLSRGEVRVAPRVLPGVPGGVGSAFLWVPLGFIPVDGGKGMVATYPTGLPLLIAATASLTGWDSAGELVLVVHSLAGVLLVYALGRRLGLSGGWAVLGAAIMAASPVYLMYSFVAMSDLPATTWVLLAVWLALRSHQRAVWALATGAALAMAVLIRPNNALAILPVGIALGVAPRRWLLLAAGGLPGAVFLCLHNRAAFGGAFASGYGAIGGMFEWRWVGGTLLHYLYWLPLLFTPVVLLGPAAAWTLRREPAKAALLGTWALAYLAFYSAYACTHETWWYLRFVLPAVPALVLAGLLVARAWTQRWAQARWGGAVLALALVAVGANGWAWNRHFYTLRAASGERAYETAAKWMRAQLPAESAIVAMQMSGSLMYYTDFIVARWDQCDDAGTGQRLLAAAAAGRRPVYAVLFPFEMEDALKLRFLGRWVQVAEFSPVTVWRRDGD